MCSFHNPFSTDAHFFPYPQCSLYHSIPGPFPAFSRENGLWQTAVLEALTVEKTQTVFLIDHLAPCPCRYKRFVSYVHNENYIGFMGVKTKMGRYLQEVFPISQLASRSRHLSVPTRLWFLCYMLQVIRPWLWICLYHFKWVSLKLRNTLSIWTFEKDVYSVIFICNFPYSFLVKIIESCSNNH